MAHILLNTYGDDNDLYETFFGFHQYTTKSVAGVVSESSVQPLSSLQLLEHVITRDSHLFTGKCVIGVPNLDHLYEQLHQLQTSIPTLDYPFVASQLEECVDLETDQLRNKLLSVHRQLARNQQVVSKKKKRASASASKHGGGGGSRGGGGKGDGIFENGGGEGEANDSSMCETFATEDVVDTESNTALSRSQIDEDVHQLESQQLTEIPIPMTYIINSRAFVERMNPEQVAHIFPALFANRQHVDTIGHISNPLTWRTFCNTYNGIAEPIRDWKMRGLGSIYGTKSFYIHCIRDMQQNRLAFMGIDEMGAYGMNIQLTKGILFGTENSAGTGTGTGEGGAAASGNRSSNSSNSSLMRVFFPNMCICKLPEESGVRIKMIRE